MSSLPHTIPGTIRALEADTVTVELSSGASFDVPRSLLSPHVEIGSEVHMAIFSDTDAAAEHERLAKAVLAELMRGA